MNRKSIFGLIILIIVIGIAVWYLISEQSKEDIEITPEETVEDLSDVEIIPISHASFVMQFEGNVIYNDPVGEARDYASAPPPDLILLSDIHGDHLSVETLEAIAGDAPIYAPQAVFDQLSESLKTQTTVIGNGEVQSVASMDISAIPMYNTEPAEDGTLYHEEGRGNGYVLDKRGIRIYIAGDTAGTEEMKNLTDIDIAFLPMNLPYTMSVEEAAEAVLQFAPRVVIPYHYRTPDGFSDVERFKQLVNDGNPDIEVRLLDWYPE